MLSTPYTTTAIATLKEQVHMKERTAASAAAAPKTVALHKCSTPCSPHELRSHCMVSSTALYCCYCTGGSSHYCCCCCSAEPTCARHMRYVALHIQHTSLLLLLFSHVPRPPYTAATATAVQRKISVCRYIARVLCCALLNSNSLVSMMLVLMIVVCLKVALLQ